MKKPRGLKRYFKNLTVQNEFTKKELADISNPTYRQLNFHIHFDNYGYGNNSFKKRKPHLDKLIRHFEYAVQETALASADAQLYAVLLNTNSRSDALFFNRAIYNCDPFPFKVSDLSEQSTLTNEPLNAYIQNLEGYNKLYGIAAEPFCLIFKSAVCLPF
ncbi:hypothetical protein [Mucilaginibacter sp. CSA2-8R]|uniref:hypothetical protein n=1 Tax=Mucilaginibacter sp. CSA2-8R TaxID=3141542 RepID=UPI00315CC298